MKQEEGKTKGKNANNTEGSKQRNTRAANHE